MGGVEFRAHARSRPARRSGSPRRCPDRPAPDAPAPARHRRRHSAALPRGSPRRSAPHPPPRPAPASPRPPRSPRPARRRRPARPARSMNAFTSDAGTAPWNAVDRLALPERIDRRDRLDAQLLRRSAAFLSTSILTSCTLPLASVTAASSIGPSVLHGPHHGRPEIDDHRHLLRGLDDIGHEASPRSTSLIRSAAAGAAVLVPSSSMSSSGSAR